MNQHDSVREMLALAASGALNPEEMRRVEQHARRCEVCRQDLETWSAYTQGLRKLPQPSMPDGLVERTRARIVREYAPASEHRHSGLLLGALAVFGWMLSLAFWALARTLTGVALNGLVWSVVSTVLAWTTAAAAAMMLGGRRDMRRFL